MTAARVNRDPRAALCHNACNCVTSTRTGRRHSLTGSSSVVKKRRRRYCRPYVPELETYEMDWNSISNLSLFGTICARNTTEIPPFYPLACLICCGVVGVPYRYRGTLKQNIDAGQSPVWLATTPGLSTKSTVHNNREVQNAPMKNQKVLKSSEKSRKSFHRIWIEDWGGLTIGQHI